jgi:hypothetical protein
MPGWTNPAISGTFNTGSIGACAAGSDCNESSSFSITDPISGISVSGNVSFATVDVAGVTTSALLDSSVTIDNPSTSGVPWFFTAAVFLSDTFDATDSEFGGVGEAGSFANSGPGSVNAQTQGRLYYQGVAGSGLVVGGSASNVPYGSGFDSPQIFSSGPGGFWSIAQTSTTLSGQTQLIGMLTAGVASGSEVEVSNFLVETGDSADLFALPEPGSFVLLATALMVAIAARTRFRRRAS